MSKKKIVLLLTSVIVLVPITIFIVRDLQTRRIITSVEESGGWLSMKEPYKSNSFDYYNDPDNWKETEQLIGQTSLKFFSQNEFTCEWKPVHSMNGLIWIITNCAEKLEDHENYRACYIIFRIGPSGNIESYYIPVGTEHAELVPFTKGPEDREMLSDKRIDHLKMRLFSDTILPPLAYDRKGLLK